MVLGGPSYADCLARTARQLSLTVIFVGRQVDPSYKAAKSILIWCSIEYTNLGKIGTYMHVAAR